ncbi:MAG: hypothetical protein JXO22_11800 [Phycisphaerae bacterium]|nr:hypothetical protein [Phycisphaerae bacterium]
MRRGPMTEMRSYRAALDRPGDVSIGAYARRVRVRRILLAILGMLLILAAVSLYFLMRPASVTPSQETMITLRCAACGHDYRMPVDPLRAYPTVCPACGERAAQPLWQCLHCGELFLPQSPTDDVVRCPKCGETAVGRPRGEAAKDAGSGS